MVLLAFNLRQLTEAHTATCAAASIIASLARIQKPQILKVAFVETNFLCHACAINLIPAIDFEKFYIDYVCLKNFFSQIKLIGSQYR